MPQTNPFTGLVPPRKMNNQELARALRLDLAAETDATNLYTAHAEATDNPKVKEALLDIANEERVHEGEFIHLIEMVTGDEGIYLQQGAEEVEKGADAKQLPQDGSGADMMSRLLPVSPEEGPPLPRALGIKWPWRSDNG